MKGTPLTWHRAVAERLQQGRGAPGRGQKSGDRVDLDACDTRGLAEVSRRTPLVRTPHEIGPDRQRRLGPGQAERAVVVMANPHHGHQCRGKSGEPGVSQVVGRAGLAGRDEIEPALAGGGGRADVKGTP